MGDEKLLENDVYVDCPPVYTSRLLCRVANRTNKVIIAPISTKGQKRFKKYKNPFNIFILSVSS